MSPSITYVQVVSLTAVGRFGHYIPTHVIMSLGIQFPYLLLSLLSLFLFLPFLAPFPSLPCSTSIPSLLHFPPFLVSSSVISFLFCYFSRTMSHLHESKGQQHSVLTPVGRGLVTVWTQDCFQTKNAAKF